jgi:hypothetical protein
VARGTADIATAVRAGLDLGRAEAIAHVAHPTALAGIWDRRSVSGYDGRTPERCAAVAGWLYGRAFACREALYDVGAWRVARAEVARAA